MVQLAFIFSIFAFGFIVIERNRRYNKHTSTKNTVKGYLSKFNMYLCLKHKLLLFPPKEICIDKKYHTLNLTTNSNILKHKNMISFKTFGKCTECLNRCIFNEDESEVVALGITFEEFKKLSNSELKELLRSKLSKQQYDYMFENKTEA